MPLTLSRTINVNEKKDLGRNDPCHCGSGKKYKKCHYAADQEANVNYTPTPGKVERIFNWLHQQSWFGELIEKHLTELLGPGAEVTEYEMQAIMEMILYEGQHEGKSPLHHFVEHASLSPDDKDYYNRWLKENVFGFFEVLDVNIGNYVIAKQLPDHPEIKIWEKMATYQIEPGMILVARVTPEGDDYIFSGGGMGPIPKQAAYGFKRNVSQISGHLTQKDWLKIKYGKDDELDKFDGLSKDEIRELSHSQVKKILTREFQKRNLSITFTELNQAIKKNKSQNHYRSILKKVENGCAEIEEVEYLMNLITRYWHTHSEASSNIVSMGPQEEELIKQLMQEAPTDKFTELAPDKRQAAIDKFADKWINTPQPELDGLSPRQAILKERNKLGNPNEHVKFSLQLNPVELPPDEGQERLGNLYNQATHLMAKQHKFSEALQLYSQLADNIMEHPEPFRWFGNVGSCLAQLGELKLAEKYCRWAVQLQPDYETALKNLKKFKDPESVQVLNIKGRGDLFLEAVKSGIDISKVTHEDSPMLRDMWWFLDELANDPVPLTLIKKDIKKEAILDLNQLLIEPDPESITLPSPKKAFTTVYKQEWQFPKVHFLHHLGLAAGWLKNFHGKLIVTESGKQWKASPVDQRFSDLLTAWWNTADWEKLFKRTNCRSDKPLAVLAGYVQEFGFYTLPALAKQRGKFNITDLLKPMVDRQQLSKEDLNMQRIIIGPILEDKLIWSGLIISTENKEVPTDPFTSMFRYQKMLSQPHLRTTPFGRRVSQAVTQAMHDAIPENIRKMKFK